MQNSFQVVLTPDVEKTLRKIQLEIAGKILQALQNLKKSPFPDGSKIKKIRTLFPAHCELKEGDYRIIFRVEQNHVIIKAIIHRKDLERELKRMK